MDEFQRFPARAHDHHMASAAAADGSASPVSPARSPVTDRTVFRFVQRNAPAITIAERPVHISRHPRSNGRHHAARNSMNYAFEWNSSKLPTGRNTEIRENQSLLSKIWPDATKLLFGFYGRPRQNILSPDNIDPGTMPAPTAGARHRGRTGFATCRRFDCARNADCRQTPCVLVNERCISRAHDGKNA